MAPGALSSLNLSCYFSHHAAVAGGSRGAPTLLLLYCSGRLGPLRHPCLCCCNQCPADTQPLGLKYVLSRRCGAGRIHHCQVSGVGQRRPRRAAAPRARPDRPHPLLPHHPQICLVPVPLATRDSLNDVLQLQQLGPSPSNLCRLSLRAHVRSHTRANTHTRLGTTSLSNPDSLCWACFFGGLNKFIFMGVYILPKHTVVIYPRYSRGASKTLHITVKRIYTHREKSGG